MFKRIWLLISFVGLLIISTNAIEVKAMNTEFSTDELSKEKKATFVSNIGVSPLSVEPDKKTISCFDVNEQGMIAIGQNDPKCMTICVYTSQGEFLYGYTFNSNQSFGVEWDGQYINVYFVRSDVIISLDSDGNILDIRRVLNTIDNNSYSNSLLYSTTRTVGDITYLIKNDMGIFNWVTPSFSQIVTIDATGTESIIYDVNSMQLSKMIAITGFIGVAVLVVIAVVLVQFTKLRRSNS